MGTKTLYTVLIVCVVLVSLCSAADPAPVPPPQTLREALREAHKKQNGIIVVEGDVMDDEGNPVPGVTAYIDRFVASGFEGKSLESKEEFSGTIRFRFEGNSNVGIIFRRDGYHAADLFYKFTEPADGVAVDGQTHIYRNVQVVMTKIKNLASLLRYSVWLKHPVHGEATVWDVSGVGAKKAKTAMADVTLDGTRPPEKVVYAAIVPAEHPAPVLAIGGRVVLRPTGQVFRIGISDMADGGFIMVPASAAEKTRYPMRELMEAPEEGYVPFIDLTDDQIRDSRQGNYYRFYFKMNGLYGKGKVYAINYLPERGLELRMDFHLQPDGSRNLETTQ